MTSTAAAALTLKNFNNNGVPSTHDASIATSLRKKVDDTTFTLAFTDSSLREPKLGKGVILGLEKPLAEGLKLNLAYDVAKRNPIAVVTLNRNVRGADAQLRATYRRAGDVLILDQQWKLDKDTTLAGSYTFSTEEAAVSLTRTHGPWTAHGAYNFAKDAVLLDVKRKSGPDTVGVTYQPREDAATLHWSRKPIRASLRASNISGRPAFSNLSASIVATHEFNL